MAIALGRAYQDARAVQSDVELHDGEISVRNIHARIVRRLTKLIVGCNRPQELLVDLIYTFYHTCVSAPLLV